MRLKGLIKTFLKLYFCFILTPFYTTAKEINDPREAQIQHWIQKVNHKFNKAPQLTVAEQQQNKDEVSYLFVDVRDKKEQLVSKIRGAITQMELEEDLAKSPEDQKFKGKIKVFYCTIGYRSSKATEVHLKRFPDDKAFNLVGGVIKWAESGGSFEDVNGPTKKVHVYGKTWSLLPKGYDAIID